MAHRKYSTKGATEKTAVIYARFSCSKQREESIEDQLRVCNEWCAREGYKVVGTYTDYAMSGRSDDRPQFQAMVDSAGESSIVLVYAFDRFSRDAFDAPAYKARLSAKGTKLVSATEPLPDGPDGILLDKIYEGFAAMESARTARRTRRGMEGNAMKCLHNGVYCFGYDCLPDGTYAVNEEEAEVVREVFTRRIHGETVNSIARDLAARGFRTSRGNPIDYTFVNRMLKSEKYIGTYVWGDIRKEHGMPQIVPEDDFYAAQLVRPSKCREDERWDDYSLTGRVYCECGASMSGASAYGHNKTKYRYYKCAHKCGMRPIRADWLEQRIVDYLRLMLEDRATALEIARKVSLAIADMADGAKLEQARKSKADAERSITNIMRAVEQGMDYADVSGRLTELKVQKARAEADIVAYEAESTVDPEEFADFLQDATGLPADKLVEALVKRVTVKPEEIDVALNYSSPIGEPSRLVMPRGFDDFASGSPVVSLGEPGKKARLSLGQGCLGLTFARVA